MPDELLSTREVAQLLHKNVLTIRRWIDAGKLPAVRLPGRGGGEWRIRRRELEDWIEAHRQSAEKGAE